MAALTDLAAEYLESAARLRIGIEEAKAQRDSMEGPERAARDRDIALLEKMLEEVREVGDLARHYYEPAYWRNRRFTL